MRQSLQSKFNLLGLLLVAFFLLMLPMFSQVKADTRDSLKEARNTALYKFSRDLAKDFKPPEDLENTQVEDYWDDYQQEAREANPDCPACNPDADADGDNMTNKEEVEQGRNPLCNEEEYGVEYCQNADPNNLTDPDDVLDRVPRVLLANLTFNWGDCSGLELPGQSCDTQEFEVESNFTLIEAYLNVTGFVGSSWRVQLRSIEDGNYGTTEGRWDYSNSSPLPTSPQNFAGRAEIEPTLPSTHSAAFSYGGGAGGGQGTWNILVYGIR